MGCRQRAARTACANRLSLFLAQPVAPSGLGSAAVSSDFYTEVFMKVFATTFCLMSVFLSGINFSEAIQCFNHPPHYCVLVAMIMDSLLISEHLEVLLGHLTLNCLRLFSFHPFQCFLNCRNVHVSTPQHVDFSETDKQSLRLY